MKPEETSEAIAETGGHNKKIAILIAILAAFLAISETGGGNAKQVALNANIDASNLWAFFQAKTVRQTVLRTAAETLELEAQGLDAERLAQFKKRMEAWAATIARYDSEPATGEGRKELADRAKKAEALRDKALAADHNFEIGSSALQLGIVLASAAVITGAMWLVAAAGGLGLLGAAFAVIGWAAPTALHW
ncbi:MAG: DUF4337 domain-containing protein [Proteobacteria bacterium]|nr:DUF4337 domain-containing protein [Pseudomonadota bacterium]